MYIIGNCKSEKYVKSLLYYCMGVIGGVLFCFFLLFSYTRIQFYYLCFPFTVIFFIINMFLFKNKQIIVFINFYIFLYFMNLFYFFYQGIRLSEYNNYQSLFLFERVCFLFYIFYFAQFCSYKRKIIENENRIIIDSKIYFSRMSIKVLLLLCIISLLLTFRIGVNMFRTGFDYLTYMRNLKSSSVIPYLFIIFFSLYAFSERRKKIVCYFFCILYIYFCLSRGFRITVVPVVLLMFLAFYENKINNILFVFLLFVAVLLILIIGQIKDSGIFSFEGLFKTSSTNVMISHHTDILYTAAAVFGLIADETISIFERFFGGISFLLQGVIMPSFFPDNFRFPLIISFYTQNGGGGLFLAGAYLFCGFLGVFLISYVINHMILSSYLSNNISKRLVVAIILVFSCNWISYDFHTILRFPIYAYVVYFVLKRTKWSIIFK